MDSKRHTVLTTGAAAVAMAATPGAFAQGSAKGDSAMRFYEKGNVRIHFEETGSGFPLLIIPGGGQNSTISWAVKSARRSTRSRNSRASIASLRPTCATRPVASHPARSK